MDRLDGKYQVRKSNGELAFFEDFNKAFDYCGAEGDKVSWQEGTGEIVLTFDGKWEYWAPELRRREQLK